MPPSWSESERHVNAEVRRISHELVELRNAITRLQIEVAVLKAKVAFWAAIGGAVGMLLVKWAMR